MLAAFLIPNCCWSQHTQQSEVPYLYMAQIVMVLLSGPMSVRVVKRFRFHTLFLCAECGFYKVPNDSLSP
jgi:hypothetical protein